MAKKNGHDGIERLNQTAERIESIIRDSVAELRGENHVQHLAVIERLDKIIANTGENYRRLEWRMRRVEKRLGIKDEEASAEE